MKNQQLFNEYLKILSDIDINLLDASRPVGLSGLFLTSVSDTYTNAKNKIMIVGSETAGWNVLPKGKSFSNLAEYVESSMVKHKEFFRNQLVAKNSRGYSFHNFTRAIGNKCGKDGLIYSNLFSFDWRKGSPIKSPYFHVIKKYSEPLLKVQIAILNPDIIIFANGMISVPYRREYFPIGESGVCVNGRDYAAKGVKNHHLWEFDLFNKIRSFRIHHPSARAKAAVQAREFLVDLLPSKSV